MAVADGRIEAGSLILGDPPTQKDFRRAAGDRLDRVMVQQLERLLSPYRARRPRALALDYGSPEGLQWAAIPNLSAGQLGGARIALAEWAANQDPPVRYDRAVGRTKAAMLADLLSGLAAATADDGGGGGQLERLNRLIENGEAEPAGGDGDLDDGFGMPCGSRSEVSARRAKLSEALQRALGGATLRHLRLVLRERGTPEAYQMALDFPGVGDLRLKYAAALGTEMTSAAMLAGEQVGGGGDDEDQDDDEGLHECDDPTCACAEGTATVEVKGETETLWLCAEAAARLEDTIVKAAPTWTKGTEDFRLAVDGIAVGWIQDRRTCAICGAACPSWPAALTPCACSQHATQVLNAAKDLDPSNRVTTIDGTAAAVLNVFLERAIAACRAEAEAEMRCCLGCGRSAGEVEEQAGNEALYGYGDKPAPEPGNMQLVCRWCLGAAEWEMARSHPSAMAESLEGTDESEWNKCREILGKLNTQALTIAGWRPGSEWRDPASRSKAAPSVTSTSGSSSAVSGTRSGSSAADTRLGARFKIDDDGNLTRKKLQGEELLEALRYRRRNSKLVSDVLVRRREKRLKMVMSDERKKTIEAACDVYDFGVIAAFLAETGEDGVVKGECDEVLPDGLQTKFRFFESQRVKELTCAEVLGQRLVDRFVATCAPADGTEDAEIVAMFRTSIKRLRWAQKCYIEVAEGGTDFTALRDAATVVGDDEGKFESDIVPTKTVKESVAAGRKARAKAEAESFKKRKRTPTKPGAGGGGNPSAAKKTKSQKRRERAERAAAKLLASMQGQAQTPAATGTPALSKKQRRQQRQAKAKNEGCWLCWSKDHQKQDCPRNKKNGGDGTRLKKPP